MSDSGSPPFPASVLEDHIKALEAEKQSIDKQTDEALAEEVVSQPIWTRDFATPPEVESAEDMTAVSGQGTSIVVYVQTIHVTHNVAHESLTMMIIIDVVVG